MQQFKPSLCRCEGKNDIYLPNVLYLREFCLLWEKLHIENESTKYIDFFFEIYIKNYQKAHRNFRYRRCIDPFSFVFYRRH